MNKSYKPANWYVQNGSYYSYNYNVSMSYGFSI